jgi:2,3-bisphosphoglycerate-independent phosphoglycerate mutase
MSIMGYDPRVYYGGRSAIEAISMGIPITEEEIGFRCNLITVQDGVMRDYSAGHIGNAEAHSLVTALQEGLGDKAIHFYPGVGYRHICKITGHEDTLDAICTPPHDIPGRPIEEYRPHGPGSGLLRELMDRSVDVLRDHPVNKARVSRGEPPATMIWLFWGSGVIPELPGFRDVYNLDASMTSGVDLLKGLAKMAGIRNLDIPGVTAGMDNDYTAQAAGALKALDKDDLVFVHIEAPDEAGHAGNIDDKIAAIEMVDEQVIGKLVSYNQEELRILAMPDHPTPIEVRTHVADPVPFVIWNSDVEAKGAAVYSEAEASRMGVLVEDGYNIVKMLLQG